MEVECPDGSRTSIVSFDSGYLFGRKHLGAAADDNISREQFRLNLVEGVADVAQLYVLGRNGNPLFTPDHFFVASLQTVK